MHWPTNILFVIVYLSLFGNKKDNEFTQNLVNLLHHSGDFRLLYISLNFQIDIAPVFAVAAAVVFAVF